MLRIDWSTLSRFPGLRAATLASGLALLAAGCGETAAPQPRVTESGKTRVSLAYLGLTCEAAMFAAQENGFFDEEGLEVELVKTDWDGLRDGLGLGKFDANYTLIMYLLKPIEQGLDVKITGGVHSGCLRVQVQPDSDIETPAQLKGKKIGIPNMGSPPFLFTSRVLAANGLDPQKDVTWVVVAPEVQTLSLEKGQIDAVADSEPLGSILAMKNHVRTIADQAVDEPYRDEYCCATVVSGKFLARDPEGAARITRALLKGALWVEKNSAAAAKMAVEKKYVASSVEMNAQALSKLRFTPSISRCRASLDLAANEMKSAGLLNPSTDPAELARSAWTDLKGVDDAWISSLVVEEVAGGGRPAPISEAEFGALAENDPNFSLMCCVGCLGMPGAVCGR